MPWESLSAGSATTTIRESVVLSHDAIATIGFGCCTRARTRWETGWVAEAATLSLAEHQSVRIDEVREPVS
jgi:hypothetical protein